MQFAEQHTEGMQRIGALVADIGVAMLTWADDGGALSSRPMTPLAMDADGALWFYVHAGARPPSGQSRVNLAFARPDPAAYVSISGRADVVDDCARVQALWRDSARAWFPEGPADPDLRLLRVDVDDAQFWDVGASAMVALPLAASVAAGAGGEAPAGGDNGRVENPRFPSALV